jgi:hypothetical protein
MGIIGLTDQGASFPFLGTIRKGGKKKKAMVKGKEKEIQGDDLNYFRLDLGGKINPELEERWISAFGKEPTQFSCLLLHETPDQAFDAWYKEYTSNHVLTKKCDGQNQCQWLTEKNSYSFTPKPCQRNSNNPCECSQSAELRVVIPDLGVMGFFKLLTHSKWDILSLSQQLNMVYLSAGKLTGIPFLVKRQPREIFANYNERKNKVTKSLLSIEVHPDVAGRVLKIIEQKAFSIMEGTPNIQPTIQGTSHATPLLMPQNYSPDDQSDDDDDILEIKSITESTTFSHDLSLLENAMKAIDWSDLRLLGYIKTTFNVGRIDQLNPNQFIELLGFLGKIARNTVKPVVPTEVVSNDLP